MSITKYNVPITSLEMKIDGTCDILKQPDTRFVRE